MAKVNVQDKLQQIKAGNFKVPSNQISIASSGGPTFNSSRNSVQDLSSSPTLNRIFTVRDRIKAPGDFSTGFEQSSKNILDTLPKQSDNQSRGLSKYDDPTSNENWFQKLFNPLQDAWGDAFNQTLEHDSSATKWYDELIKMNPGSEQKLTEWVANGIYNNQWELDGQIPTIVDPDTNQQVTIADYVNTHPAFRTTLGLIYKKRTGQPISPAYDILEPTIQTAMGSTFAGTGRDILSLVGQKDSDLYKTLSSPQAYDIDKGLGQVFDPLTFSLSRRSPFYKAFRDPETTAGKITGGVSQAAGTLLTMQALAPATGPLGSKVADIAGKSPIASAFLQRIAPGATNAFVAGFLQDPGGEGVGGFLDPVSRIKQGGTGALTYAAATGIGGVTGKLLQNSKLPTWAVRAGQGLAGGTFDVARNYAFGERDPAKLATGFGLGFAFGARTGEDDINAIFGKNPRDVISQVKNNINPNDKTTWDTNKDGKLDMNEITEAYKVSSAGKGSNLQSNNTLEQLTQGHKAGTLTDEQYSQGLQTLKSDIESGRINDSVAQTTLKLVDGELTKFGGEEPLRFSEDSKLSPDVKAILDQKDLDPIQRQEEIQRVYDSLANSNDASAEYTRRLLEQEYGIEGDTYYRGGDPEGRWYTKDPNVADGYGEVHPYRIKNEDILDLTKPQHQKIIIDQLGPEVLKELQAKGGLPDGGNPRSLEAVDKYMPELKGQFKGIKMAETFAPESDNPNTPYNEAYAPSVYIFDKSGVQSGELPVANLGNGPRKLGDPYVYNESSISQQGTDKFIQDFMDRVAGGQDPQRAYASVVKKINQEFGTNIPVKLSNEGVLPEDQVDIFDPTLNPSKLKLEGNELNQFKTLQSAFKETLLQEVEVARTQSQGMYNPKTYALMNPGADSVEGSFYAAKGVEEAGRYDQVAKAIKGGYEPKNPEALKIYNDVKESATQRFIQESMTPELQTAFKDVDQYINKPTFEEYNAQTLKAKLDAANLPFNTEKTSQQKVEEIRSISDLNNLKTNKGYDWNKWKEFISQTQNRGAGIEGLGEDATNAVRKLYGAPGMAKARILEDLQPIFKDNNIEVGELPDFEAYAAAKRNENLASKGQTGAKEIVYPKDGIFGKEQTIKVPDSVPDNPRYEKAFNQLQEYNQGILDYVYKGGLLSDESYQALKDYGDYVPFQRYLEDEYAGTAAPSGTQQLGSVSKQDLIKKYGGSDKPIISPIESIIKNTVAAEKLVNRNNVAQVTVRSMQDIPDLATEVRRVPDTKGLNPDEYISVFVNGEKQYYTAPEPVVTAAKNLTNDQMGMLTKILAAPATVLRQGATSSNIDFIIPNMVRDQFNAAINAEHGYIPFADYLSGFKSLLTRDDAYIDYLKSGAEINFGLDSKEMIDQIIPKGEDSTFTSKIPKVLNPIKWLQTLGKYSEVPTRIGVYKRAIENGATPDEAMYDSRTATADFNVKGSKMKSIAAVTPFLNARIQSFDSLAQSFRTNPKRALTATALYAVLPTVITSAWLNSTPVADQISDYDKDKYYIIPLKGSASTKPEDFVRIPKPQIAYLANPFRKAIEMGEKGQQVEPLAFFAEAADEISPVSLINADTKTGKISFNPSDVVPLAYKPPLEVLSNYDFFRERPILTENQKNLPAPYQSNSSTAPLFNDLGKTLNTSPANLQQLTYGYTAGAGKTVVDLLGKILGSEGRYPKKERAGSPALSEVPIVSRFLGVDLNTPQEQLDQYSYTISDLRKQYESIQRARNMAPAQKKYYMNQIAEQLRLLQQSKPNANQELTIGNIR